MKSMNLQLIISNALFMGHQCHMFDGIVMEKLSSQTSKILRLNISGCLFKYYYLNIISKDVFSFLWEQ